MRNIKLTIEYYGKEFNGWQKQPNKLNIQGNIERAIETITVPVNSIKYIKIKFKLTKFNKKFEFNNNIKFLFDVDLNK